MADSENSELSEGVKEASRRAYAVFMKAIDPHLKLQFSQDGFPDTLCHYTDFWGLKGILETRTLWGTHGTHTQTLNDNSEIEYGVDVIRDYVQMWPDKETAARLLAAVEGMSERAFACCFCERSDLLSMWLGYGLREEQSKHQKALNTGHQSPSMM